MSPKNDWRRLLFFAVLLISTILIAGACGSGGDDDDDDDDDDLNWQDDPQMQTDGPDALDGLTDDAAAALEAAPDWLYDKLLNAFKRLSNTTQDKYAGVILNATDPNYLDELAFIVAHSAPQDMSNMSYDPDILEHNVELIYQRDDLLDYVDIVEYGEASKGGDFYTTLKYYMPDGDFEIPMDIYYWYVVHPRLEDELPAFIEPDTGRIGDPPAGHFWREYLFEHADDLCPHPSKLQCGGDPWSDPDPVPCTTLQDELAGVEYLWEEVQNATENNGAIGVITQWVKNTLCFGAGAERPVQPVRIYHLHRGNCGEFADFTDAAARAALIPTANVDAYTNDHTWNQFYDGDWHQWEPVNTMVDNPDSYDSDEETDGWWYLFATYYVRGDGYTINNTDTYSGTCTLEVTVVDSEGNSVDGVRITSSEMRYGYWIPHFNDLTAYDGTLSILLGDSNSFCLKAVSELGTYPEGDPERVISNSHIGETYTWDVELDESRQALTIGEPSPEPEGGEHYDLKVEYDFPYQFMQGDSIVSGLEFTKQVEPGNARIFVIDSENYELYDSGEPFVAHQSVVAGSDNFHFDIPYPDTWYVVVSNEESVVAMQVGTVAVYLLDISGGDDNATEILDDNWYLYLEPGERFVIGLGGL